jgi:uncharacterized protein YndB with AHSA1/START domain
MSTTPNVIVQVTQRFTASAERVYAAWLDPGLIAWWMFGSQLMEQEVVRISVDPRVGGAFSFVVRRQGQEIDHVGEYLELVPPRRLVFTWGIVGSDSSHVVVEIVPQGAGCELMLTHELHPDWADYAGRTEMGWTKMLAALNEVL